MQLVNGAKFLNITFLLLLLTAAPAATMLGTVIATLKFMHPSLLSHKFDHIIKVLNLISLRPLYTPSDSLFI